MKQLIISINQFEIWIADLNPTIGTEAGKTRPVVIDQTNLLNKTNHPSTLICPITTKIQPDVTLLRIHLKKGAAGLLKDSDVMVDQIRVIDNKRLIKKLGKMNANQINKLKANLTIILDLA